MRTSHTRAENHSTFPTSHKFSGIASMVHASDTRGGFLGDSDASVGATPTRIRLQHASIRSQVGN